MLYCPYCGTKVKEDEHFCMQCGKKIPDIESRLVRKHFNKWWILPIVTLIVVSIGIIGFAYSLDFRTTKAMGLYTEAEKLLHEEKYEQARELLEDSIKYKKDFSHAQVALEYAIEAIQIKEQLDKAKELLNENEYKASLELLLETEEKLNNYQGPLVSLLVEKIETLHSTVKFAQLQAKIVEDPSINAIRNLIWEAEEINHPEAKELAEQLRNQLVDYTFSKASEALNDKQFNDALLITEDGLKYAPDSEKLQSLLTNINKEKHSFESAIKDRMEQAIDTAFEDYQRNANEAIELVAADLEKNEDHQITIKGQVKSNATVPITSILVEYTLVKDEEEFLTNEIYVFPSTLYPGEYGKFEFTHFDLEEEDTSNLEVSIKKITWYTE